MEENQEGRDRTDTGQGWKIFPRFGPEEPP
jgi:hypothetical protein